jgi:pentatricopeptide repeat protein
VRGVAGPDGASSLAVFQSIVGKQHDQLAPSEPQNQTSNILLVKEVARVKSMLEQEGATAADVYAFFEEWIYPQLRDLGDSTPLIVRKQLAAELFPKLADEMSRSSVVTRPTTVFRITQLMVEFSVVTPATWGDFVIGFADCICRIPTDPEAFNSIQAYETSMAQREALLHDLVDAWQAFGIPTPDSPKAAEFKITQPKDGEAPGNEATVASADTTPKNNTKSQPSRKGQQRKPTLAQRLAELFPQYSHHQLARPSWAALATYALLVDIKSRNEALWQKARPFLQMMRQPLATCFIPFFKSRAPAFQGCPSALDSLVKDFLSRRQIKQNTEWKPSTQVATSSNFAGTIHKEIGQAIKARNLTALDAAWGKFWGEEDEPSAERLRQLFKMREIFDYFVHAYMSIRQTQRSLNVWNSMVKHGIEPTLKTWTSMIQGCTNARNAHGIKTVWDRLIASGAKLDNHVWTARISGLIESNDFEAGFAALREMAQIWNERHKPEHAAVAMKPSVESINASLNWLLRYNRLPPAMDLLLWAAKQGIEPDIYTFNTMLRPLVRQGKAAQARALLDMMKSINVSADASTFTILLDGALPGISTLSPKEQVDRINYVIEEIEAAGFKPNMLNFGKMIYILLQEGGRDSDSAAVKAVLAHIWKRGFELSSHILTMLAEHYFSRDPPDAAAVTQLIETRRLRQNRSIDRVFWERVIKGYCQAGETQKALEIFDEGFTSGSTMAFSTLYELLLALLEAGENERAKTLVKAVRGMPDTDDRDGELASRPVAETQARPLRYWKHRFWHLAEQVA